MRKSASKVARKQIGTSEFATYKPVASSKKETKAMRQDQWLADLHRRHNGIDPKMALREAADPKSVAHAWIEWDQKRCAQRDQLNQMRNIIRESRYYVLLRDAPQETHKQRRWTQPARRAPYADHRQVMANAEHRQWQESAKLEQLRSWCEGVVDFEKFAPLREMILGEIARLEELETRAA